jgi:hypothetical protein
VGVEPVRGKALHLPLPEAGFILSPKLSAFLSTAMTTEDLDRYGAASEGALQGVG